MAYLDDNGLLYLWQKLKTLLAGKVDAVTGKGLSTNDYTTAEKSKLAGLSNYTLPTASATVTGGIKVGANLTISDGVLAGTPNTTYSVATATADGLMGKADKSKLDQFGAASTYALKSDLTSMYKYKGVKATVADLPTAGNVTGDVWDVTATGMNYAWNGTMWDALGEVFSVSSITNAEIDTIVAS